ncbi:MAG: Calx-beta domain-containing protein [Bacteroidota bacterium]
MEQLKPFPKILNIFIVLILTTLFTTEAHAQTLVSFTGNKATSEGNSGYTNLLFIVNLSAASSAIVSVDFATSDGSALAGSDYVALSGTIVFNPGQTSKTITVQVIGDTNIESHENFYVTLSNPVNASLGTINKVTGSIFNDDSAPLPSLSISGSLISEGNSGYTNADFGVTLSSASTSTVTVNFSTSDGNAIAGSDYVALSGTITFPPGTTTKTITVQVVGDLTNETNENFFITLSSPTNATISIAQGQGTIINDDDLPTLSIDDVSILEGDAGIKLLNFTISLSSPSSLSTSVNYATVNNTATGNSVPGLDDYTMKNDVVVLNPGVTSLIVDVPINGDVDIEGDEEFYVDLSNPVNATILKGRGVGAIITDDYPFLSINDVSITEGNSGTSAMTFNVSLSQPSPLTITVNFTTADSTALSGSDYISNTGSLTFLPGEVSKNISINIYGDTTEELDEVFNITLTNPTNAKLGDKMGVGTILNDDQPQTFTLTVIRSGSGSGTITSSPTGIDCGATCNYTFSAGTVVTLTATPDANSSFTGWSGAATGTGNANITMDGNKSVSATFTINTSTISNFIWKDINGDGIQNGSEPGFANVQVNLLDSTNTVLASTITDANGLYAFTSIPNGIYKIAVIAPTGWGFTLKYQGGNPVLDSNVDQTTGISDPFSLSFNYLDEAHDAGLVSANTTTTKTGPSTAIVGENITYTIKVHNYGPTAAAGVVVTDPLPQGTTYVVSTGNGEFANGIVTWNVGTIQYDTDAFFDVTVTTTSSGDVANTSTTVADTPDPNPNDNSSSTTTTVSPQTFTLTVARAGSGSGTVTSSPTGIDCGATCSYTFTAGTVVTLTATPDASSSFSGWSGAAAGTGNATITMDGNKSVTATFSKMQYTLVINRTGQGTVTSDIGGIFCGAACSATYDVGTIVTLTATPDTDYQFDGWSGDASGTSSTIVITMDGNKTVNASFSHQPYTLTVARTGSGSGTVTSSPTGIDCGTTCNYTFSAGTVVTLTATPDASSSFAGWSGAATGTGIATITMDGNKNLVAAFVISTSTISNFIWKDINGDGIQNGSEPGFANVQVNLLDSTNITLATTTSDASGFYAFSSVVSGTYKIKVIPPSGWGFTLKEQGGNPVIDSDVEQTTGISDPFTLSFSYLDETHDAGLVSANTTTTKTGPPTATTGEQVTYTISVHNSGPTASSGIVVSDPLPQGTTYVASTGNGEYTNGTVTWNLGTMQTNYDVTVTVTVTVDADGTITNTSTTVADTPDPNSNDNSSSTTTNVSQQTFTLTVTRIGSGSGVVTSNPFGIDCGSSCSYSFTAGTVITLTATPDASSSFAGWSGAATGTSAATITMNGHKSVAATFIQNSYSLLQGILHDLISLRSTITRKDDLKKIDEAIKYLNKALDTDYWVDGDHLQSQKGEKIFDKTKDAVNKLSDLMKEKKSSIAPGVLQGFIDRIVQVDRILATIAINDAVNLGGDTNDITKANEELSKGDNKILNAKYESGIEHYRKSWGKAIKSLPQSAKITAGASLAIYEQIAEETIPTEFGLMQNYPNPFNPITTINYNIASESKVTLKVFDMLGREIVTLVNSELSPCSYSSQFNGSELASGIYIYQIIAIPSNGSDEVFISAKKLIFMK